MNDPRKQPRAKLLIVDDEVAQMNALCHTLEAEGYVTLGFNSAQAALTALHENEVDVVLTDLMMPGMDGIAFLTAAKEIDRDLVCIVTTGHGAIETAVKAMQAGALDYIQKPFKLRQILPVLTRALTVRQLRRSNEELEQRVRQRSNELEAANQELEAFSYTVSHDLRAPLRIIASYGDFLGTQPDAKYSPDTQKAIDAIRTASRRMSELITDLLELAQVSRQNLTLKTVAVSTLVSGIVDDLRHEHLERSVDVQLIDLSDCLGDESLLRQVFINLLSNAFKFTARTTAARIEIGSRRQGAELIYFVRDNGAGFNMATADKLFTPFQRLHRTDEFAGTGIGLSIVQRIVSRHGGRVWSEGEPGKGATFSFSVPAEEKKTPSPQSLMPL